MNNIDFQSALLNTSILIDTTTQDYINVNGQIGNGNNLQCRIYQLLATPQNQWLYAPTKNYGSQLANIAATRQKFSKNQVVQFVQDALTPLTSTGDLIINSIQIPIFTLGALIINILATDNQGQDIKFTVNPLTWGNQI